jgi:xanthine dehydrogenase YagR molybdenum-binding subunit
MARRFSGERRLPACTVRQLAGRNARIPRQCVFRTRFAASCREQQAGSLCSPAAIMSAPIPVKSMGTAISRVDGKLKVTGTARYSAEFAPPNMAYAFLVMSTISKGRITAIDSSAAEKTPGVLAIITHLNAPKVAESSNAQKPEGIRIEERIPLLDDKVLYGGQYVAMVVAESLERARHAASLLRISYSAEVPVLRKEDMRADERKPKENQDEDLRVKKGDAAAVLNDSNFAKIEHTYSTPTETHNPMECSTTAATWNAPDRLTIYDATQYVKGAEGIVAHAFGLAPQSVHVICPFVGGAFGCKGPVWPHTILAVMAAKVVGRPVKLELTRQQMFSGTGHRSPTLQTIALAASKDGKLQAILHHTEVTTSPVGNYVEECGGPTNVLYDAPAIDINHEVFTVNRAQPSFMRAPGECPGTYALECAMDELAYALKMDPLKLRMVNDSPNHPIKGIPWSVKYLRECYELGAERFGWSRRNHSPRSMKDGSLLVGWGLATATYPAISLHADAHVVLAADESVLVRCATHDLGTGANTVFTQISADAIGVPVVKVRFELGDSSYPFGPVAGGSNSTATVGSAIVDAGRKLHKKLADLAVSDAKSPLFQFKADDVTMIAPGRLGAKSDSSKSDSFNNILSRAGLKNIEVDGSFKHERNEKLAFQSFGAHFCEVKIDPALPLVRVTRWVSVMNCGRVINPKTGGSQILGGIVMGVGMALEEETVYDPATGLPATRNLADYHVPVHADIHSIDVHFVGEPDYAFNPMGARGMGEIGITGAAAAVANAVYHATGKRVRDLPITIDKLI